MVNEFDNVLQKMFTIYQAKNADYGDSAQQSFDEFGPIALIVRMNDKMNRMKSLVKQEAQVKDESLADTALDLANYSAMLYMYLTNKRTE